MWNRATYLLGLVLKLASQLHPNLPHKKFSWLSNMWMASLFQWYKKIYPLMKVLCLQVVPVMEYFSTTHKIKFVCPVFFSSHILVFWSLWLRDFLSIFFCLAHLALQNVNKDYVIFLYFRNFVAKSDQKRKMGWTKR